ncbi:hypothetical protein [Rahnella inusitata]|uniref:hypothetical protein n=1 Tax=Rahnella inusitata TaxID=58169 RepID=UPI001BC858FF|nr:hypothetical protein [Rahnella inusitata]QUT17670.1 hypothetical protein I2123_23985 [Rahnella inusitata]
MSEFIATNELLEVLKERVSNAAVEAGDMRMSFIEKEVFGSLIDEVLAARRAKAPAVTPDSAPSFILDLMAQIRDAKSPEEVRAIRAKVCAADLDVAVDTFDKAIEKLSNL